MATKARKATKLHAAAAPWKKRLASLKRLHGKAGEVAFERATLGVALFEDRDFWADAGLADDSAVIAFLDPHYEDLCLRFLDLRALLAHFPDPTRWANGDLATMYDEMRAATSATQPDQAPKPTRRRATLADLADAKEQLDRKTQQLQTMKERQQASIKEAATLADQLVEAHETIRDLRSQVTALERENAELRAQLLSVQGEPAYA